MRIATSSRILGEKGEDAAAAWYVKGGYRIQARNWSCREGELDIVASNDLGVVFCEVKSRSTARHGDPASAVGYTKQQRVRRAALRWLSQQPYQSMVRFDVAVVIGGQVRIIEDAF